MTKPKLPSAGGSYARDDKGTPKLAQRTKPASAQGKTPTPKAGKKEASE